MRGIKIEKVVLNIGVGEGGEKLVKAESVLKEVSGQKPVRTLAKKSDRDFGIRRGGAIGCKVTLRGEKARSILKRLFEAVEKKIESSAFGDGRTFSFGIKEHIDIPGMSYDPKVGIFGMDVCVSLCRPGYRIRYRRVKPRPIPPSHQITSDEAIAFISKEFGVEVV